MEFTPVLLFCHIFTFLCVATVICMIGKNFFSLKIERVLEGIVKNFSFKIAISWLFLFGIFEGYIPTDVQYLISSDGIYIQITLVAM